MDIQPHATPEIDDEDDLVGELYVENDSSLLYEVKFFTDFVIVRPASPAFYLAIRKMPFTVFAKNFSEFCGNHDDARDAIRGMAPDFIVN